MAARPPDPNRILILPFRVTAADTLLGEGFAELLAAEFTGGADGIPRAVDMATALSAWRRAGGGLREPLPRARAVRLAQELGAGLLTEASIVGLGRRATVTATVLTVPDARPRGSLTRVSASADSIDGLLRATANGMLASLGGHTRVVADVRFTSSPEAMRAYLQGMAEWRRGRIPAAATWFDRAIALDSLFAQAWFRRANAASWKSPGPSPSSYSAREWALRERLSPDERMVLMAVLGRDYPRQRTMDEMRRDAEEVAKLLPESPDAQYVAGDWWFHRGSAVDPVNQVAKATHYLERAAAIDSQAGVLQHLLEIAVRARDTMLARRVLPAYARSDGEGKWLGLFIAASSFGDSATMRRIGPNPPPFMERTLWALASLFNAPMRAADMDTLMARLLRVSAPEDQPRLRAYYADVLFTRGRPAAARRYVDGTPTILADRETLAMAVTDTTGMDVDAVVARLTQVPSAHASYGSVQCMLALWRLNQDPTADVDIGLLREKDRFCVAVVEALRHNPDRASELRAVTVADSTLRQNIGFQRRYEPYLLARAWERVGQPERALAAIRTRHLTAQAFGAWSLPYEGRLALQVGDTSGAIRAYQLYVEVMADAEPPFAAKREQIREDLRRLRQRSQD